MKERIRALLVHTQQEPMAPLGFVLEQQGVDVEQVATCGEAHLTLRQDKPPHLVFTDTTLSDGQWTSALAAAKKAPLPVRAVVVSRVVDVGLYLDTLDQGAYDFLTPPFDEREVAHILKNAVSDVLTSRKRALE